MKPLGTNNAAENELTTPKRAFGKAISQCGLSTKSLKPRELTAPKNKSAVETILIGDFDHAN
ncbi:hypothetical protein P6A00_004603 [Vibrio parahaemolyticus]|uniref:Uncharacterized protein n=1 Tax=Vibrio parahaemolyticus TaxID=670 RepID=A0A9Q3UGR1_VIBPH|nr:hypothetical protein [Vibrio parahaemolyticus]EGQ7800833.1 hypothetical protein [Vibrio parahaemolyticus]EGQ8551870.1 hypothetical protein [Vibrio parahaemolyticus]EGU0150455.1 hypothetical protein [Vibrio parahaemolyticus]EHA6962362.1 hypothetical protein [Vibrio parahaemolyticus]EHA6976729.1 hypothetical protein [Vibrio parahaemolyticus]